MAEELDDFSLADLEQLQTAAYGFKGLDSSILVLAGIRMALRSIVISSS